MTDMSRPPQNGVKRKKLTLDPRLDKDIIKEKITRTILEQVTGAIHDEVYAEVDADYERLLAGASVTTHIPVLVEGEVRAEQRRRYRDHWDDATQPTRVLDDST
ncbi:MAG: hypothetical protein QNJ78_10885 [Gammaproteobacteria bacterium]|nr:hypothetical protein [Gammaproteobacteria bacterium]